MKEFFQFAWADRQYVMRKSAVAMSDRARS
jgi:hypothetical protein